MILQLGHVIQDQFMLNFPEHATSGEQSSPPQSSQSNKPSAVMAGLFAGFLHVVQFEADAGLCLNRQKEACAS